MAKIEPVESSTSQSLSTLKAKNEISNTSKDSSKDELSSRKQSATPTPTGNHPVQTEFTEAQTTTI